MKCTIKRQTRHAKARTMDGPPSGTDMPSSVTSNTPNASFIPYLDEPSGSVRFQVSLNGILCNASINQQALLHSFKAMSGTSDLLDIYNHHTQKIHEAALRRLAQGALAPVMLRECNFPPL